MGYVQVCYVQVCYVQVCYVQVWVILWTCKHSTYTNTKKRFESHSMLYVHSNHLYILKCNRYQLHPLS